MGHLSDLLSRLVLFKFSAARLARRRGGYAPAPSSAVRAVVCEGRSIPRCPKDIVAQSRLVKPGSPAQESGLTPLSGDISPLRGQTHAEACFPSPYGAPRTGANSLAPRPWTQFQTFRS